MAETLIFLGWDNLSALKTSAYKDIVYSNKHWNKFLNMANYAL